MRLSRKSDAPAAQPVERGSETVLVVDDEPLLRALAVRTLAGAGYRCLDAADAADALRVIEREQGRLDLVVTDVVMPGMSGGGLGEQLAALRPGLPVLYTSGFPDEDAIRRGLLAEGKPFLQKPFAPNDLARKVREVLDARVVRAPDDAVRVRVYLCGMYFKQMLDERCGCASYLVASRQSHEAAIIDPAVTTDQYEVLLAERGFRLTYVIDTHVHADHVSGARQLAARHGAELCLHESAQRPVSVPAAPGR